LLTHTDVELALSRTAGRTHYGERDLRAILNLYALLYDRLVVLDSAFLFNPLVQYLFAHPSSRAFGYEGMLRDGVIVPLSRDIAPSFQELQRFQRKTGMYPATDWSAAASFAEFLDDQVKERVPFNHLDFYHLYTDLATGALSSEAFRRSMGLASPTADQLLAFIDAKKSHEVDSAFRDVTRRSVFFEFADLLVQRHDPQSRRVRELGAVLGHAAYGSMLGITPAYSSLWNRPINALHSVQLSDWHDHEDLNPEDQVSETLAFDIAALESIDYDCIAEIRKSREFREYMAGLQSAASSADPVEESKRFRDALVSYLAYLESALVLSIGGSGKRAKRMRRLVTVSSYVDVGGTATITLAGAAVPVLALPAVGLGLAWAFGGIPVVRWIEARAGQEERRARAEVMSRFPKLPRAVNRGQLVLPHRTPRA